MGPSPFRVVHSRSSGQQILRFLWNLKVQYHVNKGPPLIPILNQMNSLNNTTSCFLKINL